MAKEIPAELIALPGFRKKRLGQTTTAFDLELRRLRNQRYQARIHGREGNNIDGRKFMHERKRA